MNPEPTGHLQVGVTERRRLQRNRHDRKWEIGFGVRAMF
jgi:hypothetical protein